MSSSKIKIGQLGAELEKIYKEYSDDVVKALPEVTKKAAKQCVKELKSTAPAKSGAYARSFAQKVTNSTSDKTEITVYSKKPGLPHLLEYGHTITNQYGVYGRTSAKPHWAAAEEAANQALEDEITKIVEGSG